MLAHDSALPRGLHEADKLCVKYPRFWALEGSPDGSADSRTPFRAPAEPPITAEPGSSPRRPFRRPHSAENTDSPRSSHPRGSRKRWLRSTAPRASRRAPDSIHWTRARDLAGNPRDLAGNPRADWGPPRADWASGTARRLSPNRCFHCFHCFHCWRDEVPRESGWSSMRDETVAAAILAAVLAAIRAANWAAKEAPPGFAAVVRAAKEAGISPLPQFPAVLLPSEIPAVLSRPAPPSPAANVR